MTGHQTLRFARRAARFARREIAALSALLVIALSTLTFVEVADDMTEADGQHFDQMVLTWVQPTPGQPRGPAWLEEAAIDLTSLGGLAVLGLFALVAFVFLLIERKRLSATLLAFGLLAGVAWSEGLKAVFGRARPPLDYQAVETINASFPSGHALLSAVFYLSAGVMITRAFRQRRLKIFVMAAAILITLLVGLTRIYLGAHWASDVLAGWCVGAAWAMALWLLAYAVARLQRARHAALQDENVPVADA